MTLMIYTTQEMEWDMNKLITIFLLFTAVSLSAQYTAVHDNNGEIKPLSHNGAALMVQEDNIPTTPEPSGPTKVTVWSQDFEESAIEDPYTAAHVAEDFPWYTWTATSRTSYIDTDEWISIVSYGGSRVMKNHYQAGNWGTGTEAGNNSPGDGTASNIYSNMASSGGRDELYLKYDMKISSGFDWGLGGKLPGLTIQPGYTDGGSTSGSTVLMMWQPDSAVKIYAFYDTYTFHGPVHDFTLPTDEWFSICLRVVNSSTDADDGIIEVFYNGVKDDQSITNASFREQSDKHINVLRVNFFRGGGDDSYAVDTDGDIWVDNMEVFYLTGDATTDHPIGQTASPTDRDISQYLNDLPDD